MKNYTIQLKLNGKIPVDEIKVNAPNNIGALFDAQEIFVNRYNFNVVDSGMDAGSDVCERELWVDRGDNEVYYMLEIV